MKAIFKKLFKKSIILPVTIGSTLEYYELGLPIYWTPEVELLSPIAEVINTVTAVLLGVIARPLGAFYFGKSGDQVSRRNAFLNTIRCISIITLLAALFLPSTSFSQWSLLSVSLIGLMKLLQGFPAGGELPGAICYLAENSETEDDKIFKCSFALIGPQIGLTLCIGLRLMCDKIFPKEFLFHSGYLSGWRLAFLTGGVLGVFGWFLRSWLDETREFENLPSRDRIEHPVREVFKDKGRYWIGIGLSIFEIATFCVFTIIPVFYFKAIFDLSTHGVLFINLASLFLCTILPLLIGKIAKICAQQKRQVPFMEMSVLGFVSLTPIIYFSIQNADLGLTLLVGSVLLIFFSIQVALLPSVLADLFPTPIRYTGIGFTFNVCDGIIWSLFPFLIEWWMHNFQNAAAIFGICPITGIIFLYSYFLFKKRKMVNVLDHSTTYFSGSIKSSVEADEYKKTHASSHRYLAYRDIPSLLEKYFGNEITGKVAIDYGTGTGFSADYLRKLGFKVIGVDVSEAMLSKACSEYPDIPFYQVVNGIIPIDSSSCDLIFSSFVLFEISTRETILKYLSEAKRVLKKDGLFIAITGSQDLHSPMRRWLYFHTQFPENEHLDSGKPVKLLLTESNIEFMDYYWTEDDYATLFSKAELKIMELYHPLGHANENFLWEDELEYSPYLVLIAKVKE